MTARAHRSAPRLAPALALVAPVSPPAWAEEAARARPTAPPRDLAAPRERVWHNDGRRFVERVRDVDSHHTYRAYERADCFGYGVTIDELTYGRIDTRRPTFEASIANSTFRWEMERQAEARALIESLCPETVADRDAGHRVYPGPGYVRVFRPESRHAVLAARRAP